MILINTFSLWTIGKFLNEKECSCNNIHQICSNFLSYYYGNSSYYSLYQINMMKRFYAYFPIYIECMKKIGWDSYLELLELPFKECYFYYAILLFCGDNSNELRKMINSSLYLRI